METWRHFGVSQHGHKNEPSHFWVSYLPGGPPQQSPLKTPDEILWLSRLSNQFNLSNLSNLSNLFYPILFIDLSIYASMYLQLLSPFSTLQHRSISSSVKRQLHGIHGVAQGTKTNQGEGHGLGIQEVKRRPGEVNIQKAIENGHRWHRNGWST